MKKLLYIILFAPLTLFGQDNYSLSFDGVDDYVKLDSPPFNGTQNTFSIISKFKLNVLSTSENEHDHCIYGHRGYYQDVQLVVDEGNIRFHIFNTTSNMLNLVSSSTIDANEWVTVIASYDGNTAKIYINGEIDTLANVNLGDINWANSGIHGYWIGGGDSSWNPYTNGNIDFVIFKNYALNDSEVQQCDFLNNSTSIWNFNEGFGDTVYDLSANENNGIIYGASYSEEVSEQNCDDSSSNELSIIDQLNQSFDAWNISIDLSAGWNMFGYGCPSSINVTDGLSNHTESIIITKDNNGNVYMPEFGFNGIGDFTPGFGYQIKVTEAIEGFSLCDWYVNDIPEDNIVSLQEENASLQAFVDSINSSGCIDSLACNYQALNLYDDGSCEYPTQGYDCEGNINVEVGVEAFGGIVFYVNETGDRGIVAANEDLPGVFEWGCNNIYFNGALNSFLGSGQLNTQEIINNNCTTQGTYSYDAHGIESNSIGVIAAQKVTNEIIAGYDDWYLPSKDELHHMYSSIGQGSSIDNIGNFQDNSYAYWSSTQIDEIHSWSMGFGTGEMGNGDKYGVNKIRPIRAFGNWTMGCMDTLACNYNADANMADGSCQYSQQGYDCDGNIIAEIGDIMEGGYLFYIDETGQHGLVAAMEDIEGTYEWGCYGTSISGASGQNIGTGYQNTLDIVSGCSETPITASEALAYESEGYNDWFLPSINELSTMITILENIISFSNNYYWSSSEFDNNYAYNFNFILNSSAFGSKGSIGKVRPIRSF